MKIDVIEIAGSPVVGYDIRGLTGDELNLILRALRNYSNDTHAIALKIQEQLEGRK